MLDTEFKSKTKQSIEWNSLSEIARALGVRDAVNCET